MRMNDRKSFRTHFSLCCANMMEEVKPMVAFEFPSFMAILATIKLIDTW